MKYPTAEVILKYLSITNGNINYYSNYRKDPEFTFVTNIHQHITNKTLKVLNYIEKPNKYLNYKTKNNLVSSGKNLGLLNKNMQEILKNYNIHKDGRDYFINSSAYT